MFLEGVLCVPARVCQNSMSCFFLLPLLDGKYFFLVVQFVDFRGSGYIWGTCKRVFLRNIYIYANIRSMCVSNF